MFQPKQKYSDQWTEELLQRAIDAVQGYEDYLLDRKDHNALAKIMKKLHDMIPYENSQKSQKAKKIEGRDYKEFFE